VCFFSYKDGVGWTPLTSAAKDNNKKMVEALLKFKANVNGRGVKHTHTIISNTKYNNTCMFLKIDVCKIRGV
jgi:ankyrin repeat protein